jgi:tetratricopeptide (TPR) repeat protein
MNKQFIISILLLTITLVLTSCVTFDHGWKSIIQEENGENWDQILEKARQIEYSAVSAEDVTLLINIYKDAEKSDPSNCLVLWKIGNFHMLMGAAYAENKKDKKYHYREAIKYCEKAMFTNKDFKSEVLNDIEITDACSKLTINEIDAMGYWYNARFYYFKECLSPIGRLLNTSIVIENNKMINQIDQLDSTWCGGGNYFSRAIYYISIPERFGGSLDRAEQEFATAVKLGPDYLTNRWGRAKYLYSLTGNKKGYISDLEWVLQQDPRGSTIPFPWNIYFQNDAKNMLSQIINNK